MEIGPKRIARLAAQREKENMDFRVFIKSLYGFDDPALKRMVDDAAAYYWERINCTDCGNCCRILHPKLNQNDIQRLSQRLGMKEDEFIEKYLEQGEEGLQMRETPCPFLSDKICSVYEDRPEECRGYPYLDRDIVSRMWGVIARSAECPVVYNVLEELKRRTHFRQR
ncbi:MAG: YkgJ family cysteine cluster protein [bacterium]